jgi:hypothetical protein
MSQPHDGELAAQNNGAVVLIGEVGPERQLRPTFYEMGGGAIDLFSETTSSETFAEGFHRPNGGIFHFALFTSIGDITT